MPCRYPIVHNFDPKRRSNSAQSSLPTITGRRTLGCTRDPHPWVSSVLSHTAVHPLLSSARTVMLDAAAWSGGPRSIGWTMGGKTVTPPYPAWWYGGIPASSLLPAFLCTDGEYLTNSETGIILARRPRGLRPKECDGAVYASLPSLTTLTGEKDGSLRLVITYKHREKGGTMRLIVPLSGG